MRQVLAALRLEDVPVMRVSLLEDVRELMDFRQMRERLRGASVRKPDAVGEAETRVAIDRDAELAWQQFLLHDLAQRRRFCLHRRPGQPAIPGQACADSLPADQEQRSLRGVDG